MGNDITDTLIRVDRGKIQKRQSEIEEDYELSRKIYQSILSNNLDLMNKFSDVCSQSQKARDYEVMAKLTKDTADIADKLIELQRKKQVVDMETDIEEMRANEIEGIETIELNPKQITVFSGSVDDLQRQLKEEKKENNIEKSSES